MSFQCNLLAHSLSEVFCCSPSLTIRYLAMSHEHRLLRRGTTVAIKKAKVFTEDDEEFFTELAQEALIMSSLRHPNVLQFLGTASNPPEIVIIMEYMPRGTHSSCCSYSLKFYLGSLYRIIHDKTIDIPWSRFRGMALDIARGMVWTTLSVLYH
jgi:serine/threonine protein kinase